MGLQRASLLVPKELQWLPRDLALTSHDEWLKLPDPIRRRCPLEDAWAIDPDVRYAAWEAAANKRKRLAERLLDPRNPKLKEERQTFVHRIGADPVAFFKNCAWSRDPEGPLERPRELPLIPYRYTVVKWIDVWHKGLKKKRHRAVHEKTRRNLLTITLMVFELWAWMFVPGYKSWVASHSDNAIDQLDEWDSLFGKLRYSMRKLREFFPWLLPYMPLSTDTNKKAYLRYPEWIEKGVELNRNCWGNEILGLLPSEVAGRGGACGRGTVDEAAWVKDLASFYDSIESMTPHLYLPSTPPANMQHPFAVLAKSRSKAWLVNSAHWTHNPAKVQGIEWCKGDEWGYRGPWSEWWRNPWYVERLEENRGQLHHVSRNEDLDYQATGAGKVFIGFQPSEQCGSPDRGDDSYDLYDPDWPLYVWYDVGMGDPWALIWAQVSDATGEIRIVDYYMCTDVTAEYFIPMVLGWNYDRRGEWVTAPERLPWTMRVPQSYSPEAQRIIRRWYGRRKPKMLAGDIAGRARAASSPRTVEKIWRDYGIIDVRSGSPAHNLDAWIAHANSCLPNIRISGFLVGYRPEGVWPSIDETLVYWQRMESTEAGREAKPLHDDYSHPGSALVYGLKHLPQTRYAERHRQTRVRQVMPRIRGPATMGRAPARDPSTGWL